MVKLSRISSGTISCKVEAHDIEYTDMSRKVLLDLDIGDGEGQNQIGINRDYAERYDNWRRLEEMQKLKDKYGDDAGSSSDDSTSSEEPVFWTKVHERNFLKTLSALKSHDPKIYTNAQFFNEEQEEEETKELSSSSAVSNRYKKKKAGPMYLKDYERKLIIEKDGLLSDDDEEKPMKPEGYYDQQEKIKQELKAALKDLSDSDDDNDGNDESLLTKRIKSDTEKKREDDEYYEWLKGQKEGTSGFEDLSGLRKYWDSADLNDEEKFLRDFLLEKKFEENEDDEIPTYEAITSIDEDEKELDRATEFEKKYNFRYEEPDNDFIKQYPRTIKQSIRKKDDKRKLKRIAHRERKQQEKEIKKNEIRELKTMKKKEIEEKLRKLKQLAGDDELPLNIDDLEADFNPAEYDKRMKELFNNQYYDKGDEHEEKPEFSGISDDSTDESDYDNFDVNTANIESNDLHTFDKSISVVDDGKIECREKALSRRKRKRNSKFVEAVMKKKPVYDPSEKTFEEYFNEYYALNYEDIIGDGLVTRFKYRNVPANNFGLTVQEILEADDRQLNAWASLKKATAYRSDAEEYYDIQAYAKKALNTFKKERIFATDFGGFSPFFLLQCFISSNGNEKLSKNKKRREKLRQNQQFDSHKMVQELSKASNEEESKIQKSHKSGEYENSTNFGSNKQLTITNGVSSHKLRRRKKNRKISVINGLQEIGDERLRAYGVNPKKFRNKLRYVTRNNGEY
ncbi:unnamed protein product [Dracunculus medinensis]|uniref:Protein KRI1 homolog n=1 Tax=Dracunculus medinensis TaxID=318479 RepID=A0A0N4U2Z3_DRAME|nr:unnamed protein product [Dracunculus medinensis]